MHCKIGGFFVCFVTFTSTLVYSVVWNQYVVLASHNQKMDRNISILVKQVSNLQINMSLLSALSSTKKKEGTEGQE